MTDACPLLTSQLPLRCIRYRSDCKTVRLRVISHYGVLHMNIRRFSLAGLLAVIILGSASLFADEGTETPAYSYDTKLDIARVVRIEEPQSQTCEVVQATMTYVNTQGLTKTLSFLKLADVCISNG